MYHMPHCITCVLSPRNPQTLPFQALIVTGRSCLDGRRLGLRPRSSATTVSASHEAVHMTLGHKIRSPVGSSGLTAHVITTAIPTEQTTVNTTPQIAFIHATLVPECKESNRNPHRRQPSPATVATTSIAINPQNEVFEHNHRT